MNFEIFRLRNPEAEPQALQPTWAPDLAVRLICPDCQDPVPNLIEEYSSGDIVCGSCGLVLSGRVIDTRSEWRNFNTDDGPGRDPSRVGEAYDASTSSELFTTISNAPIGGGSARQHMQELRAAQLRAAHQPPSAPVHVSRTIVQRCDQFHLGREAAVIAQELYKTVHARGIFGRGGRPTLDARIAACIFVGCRQSGSPRTLRELERLLGVDKREIGACFQTIQKQITTKQAKQTKPEELVGRFCNFLGLKVTHGVEHLALKIIEKADGRGSSQPATIAAAAIYFACTELDVKKSSKEVSEVSEIGESTIRKMYKILLSEWDIREEVKRVKNAKADDPVSL